MFEYTLKNEYGIRYTLYTDKFLEPNSYIMHLGQLCLVENIDVYNGVSVYELAESSFNIQMYGVS